MRSHKQTAALLLAGAYITCMVFFFVVRLFGLMWFQQAPPTAALTPTAEFLLMWAFWVFDMVCALRVLTELPLLHCIILAGLSRATLFCNFPAGFPVPVEVIDFAAEITLILILPTLCAPPQVKRHVTGFSILYMVGLWAYQFVMMLGRGYPLLAKYSASWQILLTIDFHLYLLGLTIVKEVTGMFRPGPGCIFFIGKFNDLAQKIGNFILTPFLGKAK